MKGIKGRKRHHTVTASEKRLILPMTHWSSSVLFQTHPCYLDTEHRAQHPNKGHCKVSVYQTVFIAIEAIFKDKYISQKKG